MFPLGKGRPVDQKDSETSVVTAKGLDVKNQDYQVNNTAYFVV